MKRLVCDTCQVEQTFSSKPGDSAAIYAYKVETLEREQAISRILNSTTSSCCLLAERPIPISSLLE